ncbi:benzoate/H(+) symporter BenE family transporter [Arenibaculum sp.]|jgi:benzoate membrane transport protein|uniref:benzoate/H(+) symporter BenE family transporter n=1 Tax=Arenibaculum sp. TaxID=2865862 RepID=UPI002E1125F6|nr:benzoate/H(+) symporter BenE family transporter [Arenibaculum sp.]
MTVDARNLSAAASAVEARPRGSILADASASAISAGVIGVVVGFGGTIALVVEAAQAAGASPAELSSWIAALCLGIGLTSFWLSWRWRQPIVTAWSTPGAALIAASTLPGGFAEATGAFLVSGALLLIAGAVGPLGRLVRRIPAAIAAGMLAGVLLRFGIGLFATMGEVPALVLPIVVLFLVLRVAAPRMAMPVVLVAGVALAWGLGVVDAGRIVLAPATLTPTMPVFDAATALGVGVPLFLVTMASQNLPGLTVLSASGYSPPARPLLGATGIASVLGAPFGSHAINLAAITAAICAGTEAHPDPRRRYVAGLAYGLCYLVLAGFGASLVSVVAALPPALVSALAGLALLGALTGALAGALGDADRRDAALIAFLVTASGLSAAGIGSAFWGLAAGLAVHTLSRYLPARR